MGPFVRRSSWLPFAIIVVVGCSSSDESAVDATAAEETAPVTSASATQPVATAPTTPELADAQAPATAVAEYSPPFPGRDELFEAPKRAQSTVRHDDEHGESVELKGFINVDRPKVVLSIDGVISPVPEGGEKYGVQVIAIEPPSVVLQRGRSRWTATLE
jgi:hypothetical protein